MKLWRYGRAIERLGRRYRLDALLGSGDMGDVCLAWDEREERAVAVKVMRTDRLDRRSLDSFLKSAEQVANWQHPHILQIYNDLNVELIDASQGSIIPYIVMEYAQGGDLCNRLHKGEPYPWQEALRVLEQVCSAVAYMHRQGVIHRNLKPSNILWRTQSGIEQAVLSDVGLAVEMDVSVRPFVHGGSLPYMAPEQLTGQISAASDIFSLGVIAYQLCTGQLPFMRIVKDVGRTQQYRFPVAATELAQVPSQLNDVVLRALAEEPEARYTSAEELWKALQRASGVVRTRVDVKTSTAEKYALERQDLVAVARGSILPGDEWRERLSPVGGGMGNISIDMINQASDVIESMHEKNMPGSQREDVWEYQERKGQQERLSEVRKEQSAPLMTWENGSRRKPTAVVEVITEGKLADGTLRKYPVEYAFEPGKSNGMISRIRLSRNRQPLSGERDMDDPLAHRSLQDIRASALAEEEPGVDTTRVYARVPWNGSPTHPVPRIQARHRRVRLVLLLCCIVTLIALGVGLSSYLLMGSAGIANYIPWVASARPVTVVLMPEGKMVTSNYTLLAVSSRPDPQQRQVSLLQISAQSQEQSRIASATGHNQIPAADASGQLTFANSALLGQMVPTGTVITASNGIQVVTDADAYIPASDTMSNKTSTTTVPAHALHAGVSGNLAQFMIDKPCCVSDGSISVRNMNAFTGGQDAKAYTFLRANDVENVIRAVQEPLIKQADAMLISQLQPGEQLLGNAQCTPIARTNQPEGDRGINVASATITVSMTCKGQGYDQQEVQELAKQLLQQQAEVELGTDYQLQGNVASHVQPLPASNAGSENEGGTATVALQVQANGAWYYQLSSARKQEIAQLVAGKRVRDAQELLLRQNGIRGAALSDANAILPADPAHIEITIQYAQTS